MHYCSARDDIQDLVRSALNGAADLAASYSKLLELRQQNESVNFELKARLFRRNEYTLEGMESDADHFIQQVNCGYFYSRKALVLTKYGVLSAVYVAECVGDAEDVGGCGVSPLQYAAAAGRAAAVARAMS